MAIGERRLHRRLPVKDLFFSVNSKVGKVSDISLGGVGFRCINGGQDLNEKSGDGTLFKSGEIFLDSLPVSSTTIHEAKGESVTLKRYGVQFGELSAGQISRLASYIAQAKRSREGAGASSQALGRGVCLPPPGKDVRRAAVGLDRLFNAMHVGIMEIDSDLNIIRANESFLKIIGIGRDKIVGRKCRDILSCGLAATQKCCLRQLESRGDKVDFEAALEYHNGCKAYFLVNATALRDTAGQLLGIVQEFRDIDRCKRLETNLRDSRGAEERLYNQLLQTKKLCATGEIYASVAHEFNNALNGIRSVMQGLAKWATLDDEQRYMADLAIRECDRVAELIRISRNCSRPTIGAKTTVDIHKILNELLLLYNKFFKIKNIRLEKHFAVDLPEIEGCPDQIRQVFLNLFNNAAEAIQGGKGLITISSRVQDQDVVICVRDNGVGIRAADRDRIFEPFFSTKTTADGNGLGLSISAEIIKRHGGRIEVDGEPGRGTAFTVIIPIKRMPDDERGENTAAPAKDAVTH